MTLKILIALTLSLVLMACAADGQPSEGLTAVQSTWEAWQATATPAPAPIPDECRPVNPDELAQQFLDDAFLLKVDWKAECVSITVPPPYRVHHWDRQDYGRGFSVELTEMRHLGYSNGRDLGFYSGKVRADFSFSFRNSEEVQDYRELAADAGINALSIAPSSTLLTAEQRQAMAMDVTDVALPPFICSGDLPRFKDWTDNPYMNLPDYSLWFKGCSVPGGRGK